MAEPKHKEVKEAKEPKQQRGPKEDTYVEIIRVYGNDIPGNKQVYTGLTYIKGISWATSNAICRLLNLDKKIKVSELTKEQVDKIEAFLQKPNFYNFMNNYQRDYETGESKHILTNELDMTREFQR